MDVIVRFNIYLHSFHRSNCYFVEICDEVSNEKCEVVFMDCCLQI